MESPSIGLTESKLPLHLLHRGKVREVYEVDEDRLLMVASDRVSAFDVVLPQPIPRKGEVLTQVTAWWVAHINPPVRHHVLSVTSDEILDAVPSLHEVPQEEWAGRSMLVRRTKPILVECVVRAYISGTAWKEFQSSGTLAGEKLPGGLVESGILPEPIFSPATKAQSGHDENITFPEVVAQLGPNLSEELRRLSFQIFRFGSSVAKQRGLLLADTKLEFGLDRAGEIVLIDEVMTPDSSRYWPELGYVPGGKQPSFDKQPIRDYLEDLPDWNKEPPAPSLPAEIIATGTERYLDLFQRLTGVGLDEFSPPRFQAE